MIPPADSLLKYDNPVLISKKTEQKSKAQALRSSTERLVDSGPIPPPPTSTSPSAEATRQQFQEILDVIHPPRLWTEGNLLWMQHVSTAPSTRVDVLKLKETLDTKIKQMQAEMTGLCPIRRALYSQCFDELLRQVTISCAERGLLLMRVKNEIQMTFATYQVLYESSLAFAPRKVLQEEKGKRDMEEKTENLKNEAEDLKKEIKEQKAKSESIVEREAEKHLLEKEKFLEEMRRLKIANGHLEAELQLKIQAKMT